MRSLPCVLGMFALFTPAILTAQSSYVPQRVYDTDDKRFVDFEAMLVELAKADVVFVGEQHDDPNTHRLELAILEGLGRRRGGVIVSLEMFERDTQEPLEHFLMDHVSEEDFLKVARPWPRYATDYKPLVEYRHVEGLAGAGGQRPQADCVRGVEVRVRRARRQERCRKEMVRAGARVFNQRRLLQAVRGRDERASRPAGIASAQADAAKREMTERFYFAQCLKDETMAESIARAHAGGVAGGRRPLVVHFNGSFHSDYGLGTAERAKRRMPGKRIVVLSLLPVKDLDGLSPSGDDRKRAAYLIYTIGRP